MIDTEAGGGWLGSVTAPFSPDAAFAFAADGLREIHDAQVERAGRDLEEAVAVASEYAKHLAGGGDPRKVPEPKPRENESRWSISTRLVPHRRGLQLVFDCWNGARDERANPFSVIFDAKKYAVAEYALDRIGEPIPYSTLGNIGGGLSKMQSDDVASALAAVQWSHGRDLVLRRLRVDGKVAYLLRPRAEGEEYVGQRYRDEESGELLQGIDAMSVPLESRAKAKEASS